MSIAVTIVILIFFSGIAGGITVWVLTTKPCIGTIHIEPDTENSGEKYVFSFDNFDSARNSKYVKMRIEDHTR